MMQPVTLSELERGINDFCKNLLPDPDDVVPVKNGKIIYDTVWKTNFFEPYEITIIDTPLFQRLRYISQMGFVDYVYPSAVHSRFDHSLGVTILASKMVDAVRRDPDVKNLIDDKDRMSIRLSALLHDVGHCLFSHTSESVYGSSLKKCKDEFKTKNNNVNPSDHEFLSYLIVRSGAFSRFFNKLKNVYRLNKLDLDEIANRIVGLVEKEEDRFKTCFINGPFDADKLDYFHRDSQFSGIPIQIDIERLFYEIAISDTSVMDDDVTETVNDLTIGISGLGCIEQIIFNKMLLFHTIYRHHKVQAIDCMFKGIFEYIIKNKIPVKINGEKKAVESPVDFLYLVDSDLFSITEYVDDKKLIRLINNIKYRKLLKRALTVNRSSITNKSGLISILSTNANRDDKNQVLRALSEKIIADAGVDCLLEEVWIDIPEIPPLKETLAINIRTSKDRANKDYKRIDDIYPYNPYKELYTIHKLKAHVFAPECHLKEIAESAKKIFKQELGIEFTEHYIE